MLWREPTDEERNNPKPHIWFGNYSNGGYSVERIGESLPDGKVEFFGAQVVQKCDPAEVPGREPMGAVVARFWGRNAEQDANRAATTSWERWAVRVGRNCPACLAHRAEYCKCNILFTPTYSGK